MTEGHALAPGDGSNAVVISSRSAEDSEEGMMEQLTALENQQAFWRVYHRNSPTWAFFTTNDSCAVDLVKPQLMRCIVCHPSRRETLGLRSTRCRKGVVLYNKEHGTSAMKRHVHAEHPQAFSRYKALRSSSEPSQVAPRQPSKKRPGPFPSPLAYGYPGTLANVYAGTNPQKEDEQHQQFLEDLALYILKAYQPLSSVENIWLRRLLLSQCPRLLFPSRLELLDAVIPKLEAKTLEKYVIPALTGCTTATMSFDLWMSCSEWSTYAVVVNFLNDAWVPCNVTIGLLETSSMAEVPLEVQLQDILSRFNLSTRIIAYVKDEGGSLDIITSALASVASCEVLEMDVPYAGACFGHAFSKCCEHATDNSKVCAGFRAVSLKDVQGSLQKSITWIQQTRKGRQEWEKVCAEKQLLPRTLKPPVKKRFASRALFFQESLHYAEAITSFFTRQSPELQFPIPSSQTWAVARAATETLVPVVKQSVLKQKTGFWFLSEALAAALSLFIHFRQTRFLASEVAASNGDDFDSELLDLKSRMEDEVLAVLEPLLSFASNFSRQNAHNMLALMLDPRFKGLGLVRDYVGADKVVVIVLEYDNMVLLPLLMQCYKRLHPTAQSQEPVTPISENSIFGAQASAEEVILEQLKSELSLFRRLHVADGEYDSPLAWWRKHEKEFRNVAFLARQILGIVGSQVEIENIFSIAGVILSQQRRRLGINHLEKLAFISKNWPDERNNAGKSEVESIEHFLEIEDRIIEDNIHLVEEADLFEKSGPH